MKGCGFWHNVETDEVISVDLGTHIRAVMAEPEKFGVTRELIDHTFAEEGEKLGLEGRARGRILRAILEQTSWVRWRETEAGSHRWTIEASSTARWNPGESRLREIMTKGAGRAADSWERFEVRYLEPGA